jgi:tRNA pseudouridine(38-40) synthase
MYDSHGMEWVGLKVTGQAFLLHQIRKMVSMGVDVARGSASADTFDKSFGDGRMKLSIAPSQGLFLDMSFFDAYSNRKDFQ